MASIQAEFVMEMRQFYAEAGTAERRLRLRYAGEEACASGHRFGGVRDHWLFHYVLEGEGRVVVEGRNYRLGRGGIFIFFPGQEHRYRASVEKPWRYAWIGFEGEGASELLAAAGITSGTAVLEAAYSPELAGLFRRAIDELRARGMLGALAGDGILRLILARLPTVAGKSEAAVFPTTGPAGYAAAARGFIEEHFTRPITVADVARHIGLDREYLASIFKAHTGTTMKTMLTDLRIERAKRLLGNTGLSVAHVASSVGYRDYAVFERAFKARTGQAPRR